MKQLWQGYAQYVVQPWMGKTGLLHPMNKLKIKLRTQYFSPSFIGNNICTDSLWQPQSFFFFSCSDVFQHNCSCLAHGKQALQHFSSFPLQVQLCLIDNKHHSSTNNCSQTVQHNYHRLRANMHCNIINSPTMQNNEMFTKWRMHIAQHLAKRW